MKGLNHLAEKMVNETVNKFIRFVRLRDWTQVVREKNKNEDGYLTKCFVVNLKNV